MSVLSVRCPHCDARPGEPCTDDDDNPCNPHKERSRASESAAGIVGRAMQSRSALEVAWINVAQEKT